MAERWTPDNGDGQHEGDPQEEAHSFESALLRLVPATAYEEALAEALAAVDAVLKRVFGQEVCVLAFGSIIQGVHLDGSDLDLCFDDPANPCAGGNLDNSRQVASLRRVMNALTGPFRVIETRFWKHMKVPIIILGFASSSGTEVEADISIGTEFEGVEKGFTDRLIRRALARSPRAAHMVRLVKLWAKVEKVNKAYEGYLNSLGWALLVVYHFLQLGEITTEFLNEEEPDERGLAGDASQLPPALHRAEAGEAGEEDTSGVPAFEEVADFFDWVAAWETWWPSEPPPVDLERADTDAGGAWGVSLVDATIIEVPLPKKQYADQCALFIEDPGVRLAKGTSENVARSLKTGTWATTLWRCQAASEALRSAGPAGAAAWVEGLLRGAETERAAKAIPPAIAASAAYKRAWPGAPGMLAVGVPPAKRPRIGGQGICKWFLQNDCWAGANCRLSHG